MGRAFYQHPIRPGRSILLPDSHVSSLLIRMVDARVYMLYSANLLYLSDNKMRNKFKSLMRRWRKLTKHQRRILVFLISLAVINIPFSPSSSLWLSVLVLYKLLDIKQLRMEQLYYYCKGRIRTVSAYMLRNRIRLLDELMESTNKYADLLLKYKHLRDAHNKMLRRRRKENKQ